MFGLFSKKKEESVPEPIEQLRNSIEPRVFKYCADRFQSLLKRYTFKIDFVLDGHAAIIFRLLLRIRILLFEVEELRELGEKVQQCESTLADSLGWVGSYSDEAYPGEVKVNPQDVLSVVEHTDKMLEAVSQYTLSNDQAKRREIFIQILWRALNIEGFVVPVPYEDHYKIDPLTASDFGRLWAIFKESKDIPNAPSYTNANFGGLWVRYDLGDMDNNAIRVRRTVAEDINEQEKDALLLEVMDLETEYMAKVVLENQMQGRKMDKETLIGTVVELIAADIGPKYKLTLDQVKDLYVKGIRKRFQNSE